MRKEARINTFVKTCDAFQEICLDEELSEELIQNKIKDKQLKENQCVGNN